MSKHYDVVHIGKGRWAEPLRLQFSTESSGYHDQMLYPGKPIKNVPEAKITQMIREHMKQKRDRPPLVDLVLVESASVEVVAEVTPAPLEEPPVKDDESKSKKRRSGFQVLIESAQKPEDDSDKS